MTMTMDPFGNLAHIHLLLNHIPTVGTVVGVGLLLLSFVRRNEHLKRASLEVFFLIAMMSLPAYLSGNVAENVINDRPDVSAASIAAHNDAAVMALLMMELTGIVAWFALWQFRRLGRPTRGALATVLVLSVITLAAMAQTANIGGEIRHEEIRAVQDAAAGEAVESAGGFLSAATIAAFITDNTWVWPASETLHFIGMCLLFGIVMAINLRLLGFMRGVSFAALHRLLPLGILGFAINTITGFLFFIGAPGQYTENPAFYWKIILMMLAGANFLYVTVVDEAWAVGAGDDPPAIIKFSAASALVLWLGVTYFGRMLPFIGNAF
jgi:uncharacterized membrane protein